MTYVVRLRDEAEGDVADASMWYEQQRARLGHEFLDDIQSLFDRIAEQPLEFPVIHRGTRRAVMNRFPFCVYFIVEQSTVVVLAVIHGSRNPRRWKKRT